MIRDNDGLWLDTSVFRRSALKFMKDGHYCDDPWGSSRWYDFWKEERRRCIDGYECEGERITGDHYFYLNYCPIMKVGVIDGKKSKKVSGFPDFWDGDYRYFWARHIAREGCSRAFFDGLRLGLDVGDEGLRGGWNLIVGKSRRKGYSYKSAAIAAKNFFCVPGSLTVLGAEDKKYLYPKGLFSMAYSYISFINMHTAWATPSDVVNKPGQGHIRASYIEYRNGIQVEGGFRSEILSLTFGDNPDAAHPYSQEVHTPDGLRFWGDISVGDRLWGFDGKECTVERVFERGEVDVYEFTFKDGRVVRSTEDHLWSFHRYGYSRVLNGGRKELRGYLMRTKEIHDMTKAKSYCRNKVKLSLPSPVCYRKKDQPIDAYVFGLLLGSGCFRRSSRNIANIVMGCEDFDAVSRFIPYGVKTYTPNRNHGIVIDGFTSIVESLGLLEKYSYEKFIPDCYLYSSIEDRLSLLRGLLDTDGSITRDFGVIEYSSSSEVMANQVLSLVRGLGMNGKIRKRSTSRRGSYRVYIYSSPDMVLFNLERKRSRMSLKSRGGRYDYLFMYSEVLSSRIVGKECSKCVQVSSGDSMYLIGDYIPTHNCRGKDAVDIFFEESGAFGVPGLLKDSYRASEDCVRAGDIKTGMITIFGTSGDMGGGTADYADMFERPEAFGLMPFRNIWDEGQSDVNVGFFHPANWNMEGFYDGEGNSDVVAAKQSVLSERQALIDKGATTSEIQLRMQERPLGPMEAFTQAQLNNFPVAELKRQLLRVKSDGKGILRGIPVELVYDGSDVIAKPLKGAVVIDSYRSLPTDLRGAFVVYEQPIAGAPRGLYKIGYDPVRQDSGTSLAALVVYKGVHIGSMRKNLVVAEYIGRLETSEDMDMLAEKAAVYYNTTIMHENEVTGVKNYFRRIKRLDLLAAQPDKVISKNIKNSKVARVYGCHMNESLKDAGERYIKDWLLEVLDYDSEGVPIRNLDNIYSKRLLEELIDYNRRGNFDMVSALIMCMIQVQEEALGTVYDDKRVHSNASKLLELMNIQFGNG